MVQKEHFLEINLSLYPFGHGLSYSNFVYESMELSNDKITVDAPVTAKIKVKNKRIKDKIIFKFVRVLMPEIINAT